MSDTDQSTAHLRGHFIILNEMNGNCLDVSDARCEDGAGIIQFPPNRQNNQQWMLVEKENGYFEIVAKHSGKALDDGHFSKKDGGLVHQWSRHGGKNQQWKLKPAGDGCFYIKSKVGGLFLDAAYDNKTVHLWTFHGGGNQKWRLRGASRTLEEAISLAVYEGRTAAEDLQLRVDEARKYLAEAVRLVQPFKEHIGPDGGVSPGTASKFIEQINARSASIQEVFERQRAVLGSVNIALFGRTGVGKSSLIEAMTQGDGITVSRGESDWTVEVRPVQWNACTLQDTPGINGWGRTQERSVLEEHARKAVETSDIVILCFDSQNQEQPEFQKVAEWIHAFGKPVIAVLNCRNAWWHLPPRVPLASARWTMSEQVRQHEGNIRDELCKLGLENIPVVAISCKRALMARAKEPFQGPDAVTFQKQREAYGVEKLLAWSGIEKLEHLIAEALLLDAPGIRLGMLVANVRGLIAELDLELDTLRKEAGEIGETFESTVAALLRILGYPDTNNSEARAPFIDADSGLDLLGELERLRGGCFETPTEGEFEAYCAHALSARFAAMRSRSLAIAEEVVLEAFNKGKDVDSHKFNKKVFNSETIEQAAKETLQDAGDFLKRKVKLVIGDSETDLSCLIYDAAHIEGSAGNLLRWTGRVSRVSGLLSGAGSAVAMTLIIANSWNPGGWVALAVVGGGAILSLLFNWGARKAEREAEKRRAKARRDALSSGSRHVHDTYDSFIRRISEAAASTGRETMGAALKLPLREAVAAQRIVHATKNAALHLSDLANALPKKEPQSIIFEASKMVEQKHRQLNPQRRFWLGEDWIDDATGLGGENDSQPQSARSTSKKAERHVIAAIRESLSSITGRPRRGDGRKWLARADIQLSGIDGGTDIVRELQLICERDQARIMLLGDYSTGKSSFIKRLFIEEGFPVPENLQVRADPTTKKIHEHEWNGIVLVDSPGMQSGCMTDDETALQALHCSSHVIFLFQPNILGGTVDRIAPFLKGDVLLAQAPKLARCLFVLNRCDELGVDPSYDPDGFERIMNRKRAELINAFSRRGIEIPESKIICMASDPFGQIGNREDVAPGNYDPYREWDGFDSFMLAMKELRTDAMRTGADIAVLEGGMARVGQLRQTVALKCEAAELQLAFHQKIERLLEAAASESLRIQNHIEARLDALLDQTTEAHIQDAMGAATDDQLREAAKGLAAWWSDKAFLAGLERWEKESRIAIDRWFKRTHDEVGRRMHSKECLRAHPEAAAAFDPNSMPQKKGEWGPLARVFQIIAETASTHKVIYNVAKTFGTKFRPWGAVKLAAKFGRASAVLAYIGVGLDVWDWIQSAKSAKKREAARRKARAFILESKNEVRKSLLGGSEGTQGPIAYLEGARREILDLRDAMAEESKQKAKEIGLYKGHMKSSDGLLSDARRRLGISTN